MTSITLTAELVQQIAAGIRAGGYPHVAAAAFGVPRRELESWLRAGREENAAEPYASFARHIEQAHGQARLRAEMTVFEDDPRTWLKHGPGRERPGRPGWSALARPASPQRKGEEDPFTSPTVGRMLEQLQVILARQVPDNAMLTRALDDLVRLSSH